MVSKSRKPNIDPDFDGLSPVPANTVVLEELFTATGFDTPSQRVSLSRCRSANEYSVGSVLRR